LKWWEEDNIIQGLTIIALAAIAIITLITLNIGGKEIVSAIGGGLVGYLAKGNK